jgi:type 1 glutamine amidotransferase
VAWIHSYGKGRVFYNSMGQFLLGDLEADTTPSAVLQRKKLAAKK